MIHAPPLRILVVDEDVTQARLVAQALTARGYAVVGVAGHDEPLAARVARDEPDVLLLRAAAVGRGVLALIESVQRTRPVAVVLFTEDESPTTIKAAVLAGVSAYVTQPLGEARLDAILHAARARFEAQRDLRDQLGRALAALEERKAIDRAKGILMRRHGCDEAAAYALLRTAAMNGKRRIGEMAEQVIRRAARAGDTAHDASPVSSSGSSPVLPQD